ncbi:MAG: RAMP superfamily protein [Oscillochloris sp.]|nr:RAMP superfamily protein [Oscillochloris sp.]
MSHELTIHLCSDSTFSNGDGVPGFVDIEIEHDSSGCPQIGARTLKGLLREECANLRFALADRWTDTPWKISERRLFGASGATNDHESIMHLADATLPPTLREHLHAQVAAWRSNPPKPDALSPDQILESLTTIRRQTAVDAVRGAPDTGSLRSVRVLLRNTPLIAPIGFRVTPTENDLALLAACILQMRRGGSGRNRGRGRIKALLHQSPVLDYHNADYTQTLFKHFRTLVVSPAPDAQAVTTE